MILYYLRRFSLSFLLVFSVLATNAQVNYEDEDELKKGAEKLFEEKKFIEASPLFSQLVSLYPKDPEYAYKYGACLIYASEDPKESLNFLEFAVSRPDVSPEAFFYLGSAYHINFNFNKAISTYEKFKLKAKGKTLKLFDADGMITMCESGKQLLKNISDLVVYEKNPSTREDYFRAYNLSEYGGQLVVKPEELMSDYEKKEDIKSIIFIPKEGNRVYFSKFEAKSTTGRDLYYADRTDDGFGKHVKLDSRINTNKDDDFAFLHPSGKVLYFASKGHNSMGGYDIFRSFLNEETGFWGEAINMEFAVNTPYDDFLMITNFEQDRAYFATNRYSKQGSVNVINIATKRINLDYAVINGNFISSETKNAKITVEDMYHNETVGSFETNVDGTYNFKLPSSGKFRFLVEAEGSLVTHAGVVELKSESTFKPLLQKMEIVKEDGDEKLIITNLLDEKLPDEQLPLTAELFQEQATLEVNYEEKAPLLVVPDEPETPEGPQLIVENKNIGSANGQGEVDSEQTSKETASDNTASVDPNDIASMDLGGLIVVASNYNKEFTEKATSFQKQSDLAQKEADSNSELAQNELAQVGQLSASPNAKDEEVVKEIEALQKEADQHQMAADNATQLAKLYADKGTDYREKAEASKGHETSLISAQEEGQTLNEIDFAEEVKSGLTELQPRFESSNTTPGNTEIYNDLFSNYEAQDKAIAENQQYITDLEPVLAKDEQKLNELKAKLESTTKKKRVKELEDEIASLEETVEVSKSEIEETNQEIAKAEAQKASISNQLNLSSNYDKKVNTNKSQDQIDAELATAVSTSGIPSNKAIKMGAVSSVADLAQANTSNLSSNSSESNTVNSSPQVANGQETSNDNLNKVLSENALLDIASADENKSGTIQSINPQANSNTPKEMPEVPLTADNVDLTTIENESYQNYNFESNYNEAFFLPVPDDAEFPLTASLGDEPAATSPIPESVSPATLPTEVEYSGQFVSLIQSADTIQNEIVREKTKGDLLDKWGYKLDTEIFFLKEKRRKATSDKRKEALTEDIDALEAQRGEIKKASNQTYEILSYKQNGELAADANNDAFMQAQLDYQSLGNVIQSGSNKENQEDFNRLGDVENNFVRLFKTADLNEQWIKDLDSEISDLEKLAVAEPDANKQRIIRKRISSLSQLRGRKQSELEITNQSVVDYAFQNPTNNTPVVKSGMTKARADYLGAQAQNSLVNSITLSDSANKVSDPELKNQLITQANQEYERSKSLANQSSDIYNSLARYSSSATKSVKFASEEEFKSADVNQLIADINKPKAKPANNGALNVQAEEEFKVSLNAMVGEPSSAQASKFLVENKKDELTTITYAIANVKDQYENETDPEKKAALETELALLVAEKRIVEAELNASKRKSELLAEAQTNATSNPQKNEENVQKLLKEAETLNQLGQDSLQYAETLKKEAESSEGDEKQRLLKEASIIEKRANGKVEAATELVRLAEQIKRVEKTALLKNQLQATVSDFNFPTSDKVLTEAEVKDLTSSEKFAEFQNIKGGYERMIKQAEVMYTESDAKRGEAEKLFAEANDLRRQAAEATDSEERARLYKEAEVREQKAKATLKESEQMEAAAVELSQNAIAKKKELEDFVANLSPALAAKIVAYEKKAVEGGSYGGVLADGTNNSGSTAASGAVTPESVKGSQFYAGNVSDLEVKYDPATKAIFKIGDASTAYYNQAQPIQFNPELPSGLVYKVQIGAFSKRIDPGQFKGFAPITAENAGGNLIRYTAGLFEDFSPANSAKGEIRKIGYGDAFVVAYYNGKRISAADARDLKNLAGAQSADLSGKGRPVQPIGTGGSGATASSGTTSTGSSSSVGSGGGTPIRVDNLPPTPTNIINSTNVQGGVANPSVTDMSNLVGTYYTVQVGVFSKPVTASDLKNVSPIQVYKTNSGFYRYNSGVFDNLADAVAAKNKIVGLGISDAFVTAYQNRQRITPDQAKATLKASGSNLSNGGDNSNSNNTTRGGNTTPSNNTSNNQIDEATTSNNTNNLPSSNNSGIGAVPSINNGSSADMGDIKFRVQVGAYEADIPVDQAKAILDLTSFGLDIDESQPGLTRYVVGNFNSYDEAFNLRGEMIGRGLIDAFVIALQNGKRISVDEARTLLNQ